MLTKAFFPQTPAYRNGKTIYQPVFTFPSAIVPKTTNRTAGSTPFVNLQKRKLDFEQGGSGGKNVL